MRNKKYCINFIAFNSTYVNMQIFKEFKEYIENIQSDIVKTTLKESIETFNKIRIGYKEDTLSKWTKYARATISIEFIINYLKTIDFIELVFAHSRIIVKKTVKNIFIEERNLILNKLKENPKDKFLIYL